MRGDQATVRRRRRSSLVGHAWTGSRAVHTYQPGPIRGPSYHPTTRAAGLGQPGRGQARLAGIGARPFKWRPPPGRRQGGTRSLAGCGGGGLPALGRTPQSDSDQSQARDESRASAGRGAENGKSSRAAVRVTAGLNPGDWAYTRGPLRAEPRPADSTQGSVSQWPTATEPLVAEPPHDP